MTARRRYAKDSKKAARRARSGGRRSKAPPVRGLVIALGLTIAVVLAVWNASRESSPPEDRLDGALRTWADSLDRATNRGDWPEAVRWAQRLAQARPKDSEIVRRLASSLHNGATAVENRPVGERPATRTSLDRIEVEKQALALADSAASLARSPDQWIAAARWRGQILEYLGLPLDAWLVYRQMADADPNDIESIQRGRWVEARLRDPLLPDAAQVPAIPARSEALRPSIP